MRFVLRSRGVAPLALALLGFAAARPAPADDAPAEPRPDVLFIAVDDLNDWIGCLTDDRSPLAGGHPDTHTPHLDRLAARGTLFTNAHCAAPACNPSRLAVMTGLRPSTTGLYVNNQNWYAASQDVPVLTETFKNAGYHVRAGGKLFHGGNRHETDERFWHEYFPLPGFPVPPEAKKGTANGLGRGHFDWAPLAVDDEAMGDTKLVDWATGVLKADATDAPRFTAVGLYRPHLPWFVPQKYFDAVPENPTLPPVQTGDLNDVPPAGVRMAKPDGDHAVVTQADQWGAGVRAYLASIRYADGQVGRLLDALDASGRADKTILVLWGDHGWHLGEKEHWRKFTLWERATRVPLMIVAPGVATGSQGTGGARCDAPVELTSLFPTLCDLCGVAPAGEFDAPSLRPLLEDPEAAWEHVAVTTHGRGNTSVRGPRFRLIRYQNGDQELYDHESDPGEYRNLLTHADRQPALEALQKRLPTDYAPNAANDQNRPKRRPQGR